METIKVIDALDLSKVTEFKKRIDNLIAQGEYEIILDLEKCNFIDSSGIGMIIGVSKKLKVYDGRLILINKPESLQRITNVLGLTFVWNNDE